MLARQLSPVSLCTWACVRAVEWVQNKSVSWFSSCKKKNSSSEKWSGSFHDTPLDSLTHPIHSLSSGSLKRRQVRRKKKKYQLNDVRSNERRIHTNNEKMVLSRGLHLLWLGVKVVKRTPQIEQMTKRLSNSLNFFRWHGHQYQTKRNGTIQIQKYWRTFLNIISTVGVLNGKLQCINKRRGKVVDCVNCMRKQNDSCSPFFLSIAFSLLKNNGKWFIYKHKVNDTTAHGYEPFRVRISIVNIVTFVAAIANAVTSQHFSVCFIRIWLQWK